MTFKDLLIKPELIDALQVQNITQPTQIQCKAAKPVFDGRDMIACSSTGSGKTLAYLLPVLSSVDFAENTLQALVLVPTQELASQVNKQIQLLFDNMHSDAHTLMLIGDGNITRQIESLKIKPVMGSTEEGTICQLDQARGMNRALIKMVEQVIEKTADSADKVLAISHCNCPARAQVLKEAFQERMKLAKVVVLDTAGVSSMYANDGGVIVAV